MKIGKRNRFNGGVVVALVLVAAVAWAVKGCVFPYTWNYKITIEIETPEGVKTGTAVRQVINRDNSLLGMNLGDVPSRKANVKGEAVVIDLG